MSAIYDPPLLFIHFAYCTPTHAHPYDFTNKQDIPEGGVTHKTAETERHSGYVYW